MSPPSVSSTRPGAADLKDIRTVQSSAPRDSPRVKCKPDCGEFPEAEFAHNLILLIEGIAEVHRVITADTVVFDVFFVELYDARWVDGALFPAGVAFGCRYTDTREADSRALERIGRAEYGCRVFRIRALAGEVEVC